MGSGMTKNKRAKQAARGRQKATGERYTAARRRTARGDRFFENDCCANCLERLPDEIEGVFCSELCSYTADTIRYWRRIDRDGRIEKPDVRRALATRTAHILAGGYHKAARRLSPQIREQVHERDSGRCVACGEPGEEIDHIRDDSPALDNLQLLCKDCHHAKTAERMAPASEAQQRAIDHLYRTRIQPDIPAQLCDDEERWKHQWRALKNARRQRLVNRIEAMALDPEDFRGLSRAEIVAEIDEVLADDTGGWTEDDDSGYGPYSYFAHAMARAD